MTKIEFLSEVKKDYPSLTSFLKECGDKNPSSNSYYIRKKAKEINPLYIKLLITIRQNKEKGSLIQKLLTSKDI